MPKEIEPRNKEGLRHGYWEVHSSRNWGEWGWKGVQVNNRAYGYQEWYNENDGVNEDWTGYYIDDSKVSDNNDEGYCIIWNKLNA